MRRASHLCSSSRRRSTTPSAGASARRAHRPAHAQLKSTSSSSRTLRPAHPHPPAFSTAIQQRARSEQGVEAREAGLTPAPRRRPPPGAAAARRRLPATGRTGSGTSRIPTPGRRSEPESTARGRARARRALGSAPRPRPGGAPLPSAGRRGQRGRGARWLAAVVDAGRCAAARWHAHLSKRLLDGGQ